MIKEKINLDNLGGYFNVKIVDLAFNSLSSTPVKLEVFLNQEKIGESIANIYRKDILDKGMHKTGKVGYEFYLDLNTMVLAAFDVWFKSTNDAVKNSLFVLGFFNDLNLFSYPSLRL